MLSFLQSETEPSPRVVIVSPHPDDEIIGAGSRLPLLRECVVAQVTDGSPPDPGDAESAGFASTEEYARARHRELRAALALTGHREVLELGFPDQRASFHLAELTVRLRELFLQLQPAFVLTVPYEGGHPDHDATAFGVQAACRSLESWQRPAVIEMLSYHNANGSCAMGEFLDEDQKQVLTIQLGTENQAFKRKLFDCFASQQRVLRWFQTSVEKFRIAPTYNFLEPPHDGTLYYEMFPWGMTGESWRRLAAEALRELMEQHSHA